MIFFYKKPMTAVPGNDARIPPYDHRKAQERFCGEKWESVRLAPLAAHFERSNELKNIYYPGDICPICSQQYRAIEFSEDVCVFHLNFLVTICSVCGKPSFSDAAGLCPVCAQDQPTVFAKGSGDPRLSLKMAGLENWE